MPEVIANETMLRLLAFAGVFLVMTVWEGLAQRRDRALSRLKRWPGNLVVSVLNTVAARIAMPFGLAGLALGLQEAGFGLFNWLAVPFVLALPLALVLLDLAIYAQHRVFHAVPVLWRLHRVHHADPDLDVSSALRFHPLEIVISLAFKAAVVALAGVPPEAIILFEIVLNATAMFNHGNVALPDSFDRMLRQVVVTPDMHRIHHSMKPHETNSNFGFNLAVWDRLFGTYRAQPEEGQARMRIGLEEYPGLDPTRLGWILASPFREPERRGSARPDALP